MLPYFFGGFLRLDVSPGDTVTPRCSNRYFTDSPGEPIGAPSDSVLLASV